MSIQFANNATGGLSGAIETDSTSLEVKTGQGDRFPDVADPDYFYVTLVDGSGNREIVKVTARASASDTMTIVRAQEGTSARAFQEDDVVELRLTAGTIAAIQAEAVAVDAALTSHKTSFDHDGRYFTETEIGTNHYTKTNLQTSGGASVHSANLTNKTSISHSQITDDQATKHRLINDSGTLTTELFSASKILGIQSTLQTNIDGKSATSHTHDSRYYTEIEVAALLAGKLGIEHITGVMGSSDHDSRYYTESEVNTLLAAKASSTHNHDLVYSALGHTHTGLHVPVVVAASQATTLSTSVVSGVFLSFRLYFPVAVTSYQACAYINVTGKTSRFSLSVSGTYPQVGYADLEGAAGSIKYISSAGGISIGAGWRLIELRLDHVAGSGSQVAYTDGSWSVCFW